MITFYDHFHFINAWEPPEALLRENSPVREIGCGIPVEPKADSNCDSGGGMGSIRRNQISHLTHSVSLEAS
jgi:hypothetical protein